MSELKAYTFSAMERIGLADYYLKSEADKVIEEKDSEIARLNAIRKVHVEAIYSMEAGLLQDDKEIRHQKYNRCLAIAKWCYSRDCMMVTAAHESGTFFTDSWYWKRASWYGKWHNRWLAIAEKFKEAK